MKIGISAEFIYITIEVETKLAIEASHSTTKLTPPTDYSITQKKNNLISSCA